MDGEKNRKPYEQMDDFRVQPIEMDDLKGKTGEMIQFDEHISNRKYQHQKKEHDECCAIPITHSKKKHEARLWTRERQ